MEQKSGEKSLKNRIRTGKICREDVTRRLVVQMQSRLSFMKTTALSSENMRSHRQMTLQLGVSYFFAVSSYPNRCARIPTI